MITTLLSPQALEIIQRLPNNKESVYIVRNKELVSIENLSNSPDEILFDRDYLEPGDILFHTHFGDHMEALLSPEDIRTSRDLNIPVLLYHVDFRQWDYFNPSFPHPYPVRIKDSSNVKQTDYLSLPYNEYRCNCYLLVRDYAKQFFNVDYPYINFDTCDHSRVFMNPSELGFKQRFDSPQVGDLVLLYISREVPFHVALIVGLEPYPIALHIFSQKHPSEIIRLDTIKKNIISVWTY